MSRQPRPRGTLRYEKPSLGVDELLARLVDRGLDIQDENKARRYLQHIGYYRLSPYTIPFRYRSDGHFRGGTTFDDVLDLYVFDRELRLLVMDALERIEVAVRAALTDHMSTKYANPHWYTDAAHFKNRSKHATFLEIVERTCNERLSGTPDTGEGSLVHPSALEHYLTKYGSPQLPPSWLMVENLTIGQLTSGYRNLAVSADKNAVAKGIGLYAPVLESWMQTYVRLRNICAHHGRLWNVGLGVYPVIPTSSAISWLESDQALPERSSKRLYPVLVSLQAVLNSVSPHSKWAEQLHHLLETRPTMNLEGMGKPEGWAHDGFWSQHLT